MTAIILLSGKKGSGKSTVASYIKNNYFLFRELALADPLKQAVKSIFDLSEDQLHDKKEKIDFRWGKSPRQLFQIVGDLLRVNASNAVNLKHSIFIENIYYKILGLYRDTNIIISDVRYAEEYEALKKLPNIISIKLVRDSGVVDPHSSEQVLFDCDYTVNNNGTTDQLFRSIDVIIGGTSVIKINDEETND
jgi:hypothetical protein